MASIVRKNIAPRNIRICFRIYCKISFIPISFSYPSIYKISRYFIMQIIQFLFLDCNVLCFQNLFFQTASCASFWRSEFFVLPEIRRNFFVKQKRCIPYLYDIHLCSHFCFLSLLFFTLRIQCISKRISNKVDCHYKYHDHHSRRNPHPRLRRQNSQ